MQCDAIGYQGKTLCAQVPSHMAALCSVAEIDQVQILSVLMSNHVPPIP